MHAEASPSPSPESSSLDVSAPNSGLDQSKEVEFYAASVTAWFTTRLEYDKSVFALSAGGIGILVTLLTTKGTDSLTTLYLYVLSLGSFLAALVALLIIFRQNSKHILGILQGNTDLASKLLSMLDLTVLVSFACGAAFSVALGIVTAYGSYREKGKEMAEQKQAKGVMVFDSVLGAANLRPQALLQKSFSGAGALQPQALTQQATSGAAEPSSASASAAAPASTPLAQPAKPSK